MKERRLRVEQRIPTDVRDSVTGDAFGVRQAREWLVAGEAIVAGPLVRL